MSEIIEKWEAIKEKVREEFEISDVSFRTWIEPLKIHSVEDYNVIIIIPSNNAQSVNYINSKYGKPFMVTISEMFDHDYSVSFQLEKDLPEDNSFKSPVNNVFNINSENANLNPKYKFDTFVVGSNNKMAHAASLAVAESPGTVYNPLYIYGGAGLGKTHLMHAIGHFILEQNPKKKVLYVTSEQFTNEVIESVRSGNATAITKLREKYRTVDVLMVDDVQFIIGKDSTQEEFFNTFNALYGAGKAIVLSSDKPPKKMETLEERFRSRFEMGLITDIQAPDYETRMAILMKKAETSDRFINKETIEYIATNIKSNIRELEGAFNIIVAYSKLNNVDMTREIAEDVLRDVIYPDKPLKITPSYVIKIVSDHYGIDEDLVKSNKRQKDIAFPRHVAMYLSNKMTDCSLVEIGKAFGGKDHSTVIHGIDNIDKLIKKDPDFASKIEIIKSKISSN